MKCPGPWCTNDVPQRTNRYGGIEGRPAKYCSDECRKAAYRHRKIAERREAERLAAIAAAEEDRRRRVELAGQLALAAMHNPGRLAEWLNRHPNFEWQLHDLVRFLERST